MIEQIYHVGLTVSDLDRSIRFYRDVLGLKYQGEIQMDGIETENMFQKPGCKARVAYLNGAEDLKMPPVELIQFVDSDIAESRPSLFQTSISELCFLTDDIDREYERLCGLGVDMISKPQTFDSTAYGFGRSRAVYFLDPDRNVLELIQSLD